MYDQSLVKEILTQTSQAIDIILYRYSLAVGSNRASPNARERFVSTSFQSLPVEYK